MTRKTVIAVAIQIAMMLVGLVSPLAVRTTGTTVYLETRPIDPRALFRGDYVTLGYSVGESILSPEMAEESRKTGEPIYVTVTTDRPALFVDASFERPEPEPGQVCLRGRIRRFGDQRTVDFPQIAQYFVAEGEGRAIERRLGEYLLAEAKVSGRCNAVLVGLEPR
jgi:uncharacterized membrane-anchored protein